MMGELGLDVGKCPRLGSFERLLVEQPQSPIQPHANTPAITLKNRNRRWDRHDTAALCMYCLRTSRRMITVSGLARQDAIKTCRPVHYLGRWNVNTSKINHGQT
jgi:hypothetical protein